MERPQSFARLAAAAGAAATGAECLTMPLDTLKIRMQVDSSGSRGLAQTLTTLIKEGGPTAPWRGLGAGIQRQLVYGTLRISLYSPIRDALAAWRSPEGGAEAARGGGDGRGKDGAAVTPLSTKIAAGMISGALGICVANPTDVVKIRMQAHSGAAQVHPSRPKSASVSGMYRHIFLQQGVRGLWRGVGPNVLRNCIFNAAELAVYDETKEMLLASSLMADGIRLHAVAGFAAGAAAVVVGSPIDVLKTKVINDVAPRTSRVPRVLTACASAYRAGGLRAFYRGFNSNVARLGSFNLAVFVLYEKFLGLLRAL
eukprot:GHVT01032950.1.p1 GENE.GHVT01032950.1~~GHVT01032950.1.p1  ORF type:complete len:313 (-),score=97.23 GHVT01032950.1:537-1475(-)